MSRTPEQRARMRIDADLAESGWVVQNLEDANLSAALGVAVREVTLRTGHGRVDYLLFVDGNPVGVLEAKPEGHPLSGVEPQTQIYSAGLPFYLQAPVDPLPFLYRSTGALTAFTNLLDPVPASRAIFQIHRPETIAEWLLEPAIQPLREAGMIFDRDSPGRPKPGSLRRRLRVLPETDLPDLWPNQQEAIRGLEKSLRQDRPRALIQMATGSGKTRAAVAASYRLIKHGGARRILFLVDRTNLGVQAEEAFTGYVTPDDHRKLDELYGIQRLEGGSIGQASKIVITTIQRLYSILQGKAEPEPEDEEGSLFEGADAGPEGGPAEALPVVYNPKIPPEFFDVIFIDECHRSIYTVWRQVLEYFDAYLIGLTATPAAHTYGFFEQNVVMEYSYERSVSECVNVPFALYRIRTQITEQGSTIEASAEPILGLRSRRSGTKRWVRPDVDLTYTGGDLDRAVVAEDQIRLIARTFRDRMLPEMFPERDEVPKTLIFAKDDRHAEDIVEIFRKEFGLGDQFCQKITYRTTGKKPKDLISDFRIRYFPRVAVTVDMIATGTDIKPIEIVMFLRAVKSRLYFEQMKGRGVRTIPPDDLIGVSPTATTKSRFVVVDCVGITETDLADSRPLERKPSQSLAMLLNQVALGTRDPEIHSTVAARLLRLDRELAARRDPSVRERLKELAGGATLSEIAGEIVRALEDDAAIEAARADLGLSADEEPPSAAIEAAERRMLREAARPLATLPALRTAILEAKEDLEQVVDAVSRDVLLEAGAPEAKERAQALVQDFEAYLAENKNEIEALQFFYSVDYRHRLRFDDIQRLAAAIGSPPRSWTPEGLWRAYSVLEQDKVRGASAKRLLTDVVSLVRFALHQDEELVPFPERVERKFRVWLQQQETAGRRFSKSQLRWLEMMRDHIGASLTVEVDDFDYTPFVDEGGLGKARQVFGEELGEVMRELNEALAA
ncbi:MAG TPA: type I restriction-modification enzyme R subunit C-terminal domain-containing protein [Thermoanaerobaculia bacterium]|nr:type I restriction-modification enzyme R subunit C-terminal domain-containing protein [Thermoanaerobaculia bacterium]